MSGCANMGTRWLCNQVTRWPGNQAAPIWGPGQCSVAEFALASLWSSATSVCHLWRWRICWIVYFFVVFLFPREPLIISFLYLSPISSKGFSFNSIPIKSHCLHFCAFAALHVDRRFSQVYFVNYVNTAIFSVTETKEALFLKFKSISWVQLRLWQGQH